MESLTLDILTEIERISKSSTCTRRQFCAIIYDPFRGEIISKGINHSKNQPLCGGQYCLRDKKGVKSGSNLSLGCIHAEADAIQKALDLYKSTYGLWLFINGEPCLNCANLILQNGLSRVFYKEGVYSSQEGVKLLQEKKVELRPYTIQV